LRLTADNYRILSNGLGRSPTQAELYLAHQQGAGGALKLLHNPDTSAGSLLSPHAISQNGGNPNAPASTFVDKWASRWQGTAPAAPAAPATGAASYAATPPSSQDNPPPIPPAAPASQGGQGSQSVIPGQGDPHKPGFDPSAVPFHQTPDMNQGAASVPIPPPPGPTTPPGPQGMNDPGQGQSMLAQQPPIDPLALALAGGGDPNNPQMSPAIVAMLNAAAPAPEISMSDFGGLGGLFG
jgi:hypothetical protein